MAMEVQRIPWTGQTTILPFRQLGGMFSLRKRNSMKKTPEELAIRMIIIEQTLQTRRNAICKEIERKMYIQGACLEKHRHNLQITHELMSRGLLWP